MKKLLRLLLFINIVISTPCFSKSFDLQQQKKESIVYVCDSKTSYAYHTSSTYSGLLRCTHKIIKMSETDAKKANRTPCKKCH